jgi:hypothetical protein
METIRGAVERARSPSRPRQRSVNPVLDVIDEVNDHRAAFAQRGDPPQAGRPGFQVVAGEIRSLAVKTGRRRWRR